MLLIGFIVAQIIIFGIIVFVLKRLIFQDTTSAINRINKLDTVTREKEKILTQKLEENEKFLESRKKELLEEEARLKQEAQRAATQLHEDLIKAARVEADDIIKKAQAARDKMKTDATIEADGKMIEFCRDILGKLFSIIIQGQINEQLVQEFLADLEQADFGKINKDLARVEVVTGQPLNEETKKIIKKILDGKLGRAIEVDLKEDRAILGGLLLKFGTMVVDGTLAEHLKEVSAQLKDDLSWKHN